MSAGAKTIRPGPEREPAGAPYEDRAFRLRMAALDSVALVLLALVAAIAVIVLGGWAVRSHNLTAVVPGEVSMKANTAVCFLLLVFAILRRRLGPDPIAIAAALAAGAIAGVTLAEHLSDWDAGIDELVFDDFDDPINTSSPGRMAPNSAVGFIVLALAVIAWDTRIGRTHPTNAAAVVVGGIAILVAAGYATETDELESFGDLTRMAVNAALCFLLLAAAVLATRADRGLMAYLANRGPAAQLLRVLLPASMAAPLILGALAFRGAELGLYSDRAAGWYLIVALLVVAIFALSSFARSLQRSESEREQAMEKAQTFFEISLDGLCTATPDGYFLDLSESWEQTLGYTLDELRSRPFVEFVHPDDREETEREAARLFGEDHVTVDFVNRYRTAAGGWRWLSWRAVVVGSPPLIYARATDITESKKREAKLNELVDDLARSNADLEEFASIASHDLAEPLRTIGGFSQLLERQYKGSFDDRGERYLEHIVNGSTRMMDLITDLLDYSRAGRSRLELAAVDLNEVAAAVIASLDSAIAARGGRVEVVGDLPRVPADEVKVSQVLQNLVVNALKFSEAEPRVEISATRGAAGWEIAVADNGIGIDPDQRRRVFEPFKRLHGRDAYAGSGIGLAVCQRLVERHGGKIRAEEGEGGSGARVIFTLPPSPAAAEPEGLATGILDRS